MAAARHLVARQIIEIVAGDRRDAEALTARTSAAAPVLAAAIERTLDAFDAPGHRIRLDRVEIDLGACDPARWEEALVAGIERELGARLPGPDAGDGGAPDDRVEAAAVLLATFARSGRLPWWCGAADTPDGAVAELVAGGVAPDTARRLLELPEAIERFVRQLDDDALAGLASLAAGPPPERLPEAAVALAARAAAAGGGAARATFWRAVLRSAAAGGQAGLAAAATAEGQGTEHRTPDQPPGAARPAGVRQPGATGVGQGVGAGEASAGVPAAPGSEGEPPVRAPAGATAAEAAPAVLAARLAALARRLPAWSALLRHLATLGEALGAPAAEAALRALGAGEAPGLAALAGVLDAFVAAGSLGRDEAEGWLAAAARTAVVADPHDAIAIQDAGLPLVLPFLPAFFERLGLVDEADFRDEPSRHRAVSLLAFLASGEREAPEPRLSLAKLLAGLDPDAVHDPSEPLGDEEAEAGEALLAAVIGHAPMLGRIGVEGLRGAFLRRPGTLSTRDGHWLLRVERRSFDILLDRLPWTLGWARLPWMPAPLQIEW